ncbi:RNA-directed DNA polymerase [Spirillospora sp. CA-253888]
MALMKSSAIKQAVRNVAKWGDTDVFPFPIENHVLHDKGAEMQRLIGSMSSSKEFDNYINTEPVSFHSTLAPVGYTGFRWATQIDPLWNTYLLALTLELAPSIEGARVPRDANSVFSYRYSGEQEDSLFDPAGWRSFQAETRLRADKHKYVISVDIADFYSRIYHHRLENALRKIDGAGTVTRQIMSILSKLSTNTSYGLPVGGPAARIMSELALNRVDLLLSRNPLTSNFCRYADDYRFFVDDIPSAYRCIGFLAEKLQRNDGLALQKSKTRIMTSSEYLSTLDPADPKDGSAAKFLGLHIHYDPYSATAAEDYDRLKEKLSEFDVVSLLRAELKKGRIHIALTRRLAAALQHMDQTTREQAIKSLMENVDKLAPVFPQVMLSIRRALDSAEDEGFVERVHASIRELIETSHYVANIELNLAFMVRVLSGRQSIENEQLLIGLYNAAHGFEAAPSPAIRRDIMLTMARWGADYWLSDRKNYVSSEHPWVRRAFIISSYVLGDEGKHWRSANKASMRPFEEIVRDWAAEKRQAPGEWNIPV